jgi:molybdopterin biosynthesis enzyme
VGFELFVRPAILALQGADPGPHYRPGVLGASVRRNETRDELLRARIGSDGEAVVLEPLRGQESHMIVRASGAGALVHVPRGNGVLAAGASVRYIELG